MINEWLRTIARKMLAVAALVAVSTTAANAVVVLRTAPFPRTVATGAAHCAARNGGTSTVNVAVTMFNAESNQVLSTNTLLLEPDDADFGTPVSLAGLSPSWCECSVPSSTTFTCSFVYINGPIVTVVPAQ